MKRIYKIAVIFLLLIAIIFFFGNFALSQTEKNDGNNYYKVEINRVISNGVENFMPDEYECIKAVEILSETPDEAEVENFYRDSNNKYTIIRNNGRLIRFVYEQKDNSSMGKYIVLNVTLSVITVLFATVLVLVYFKVLMPFRTITKLPYELSRGNLTSEIPENKNRFFGKFIWGLNLLRENLNEHKQNELALMKQQKTMILSISHDIKTPLSAIKLYVKALSRNMYSDEEKRNEVLQKMDMHADAINDAVNEIIKNSSEDFINLETVEDEFYLASLMDKIVDYYKEKLEFARIGFSVAEYDNCLLAGDFDRCVEVLENLMENAIKYGDGKLVDISFLNEDGCVLVTVKNTGCTLNENEMLHIFDSFWRGSNSSAASGSGLGLYICRTLMRKMNGDIFAQTDDGDFAVTAVFRMV